MKSILISGLCLTFLALAACQQPSGGPVQDQAMLLQSDKDFAAASAQHGAAEAWKMFGDDDMVELPNGGYPIFGMDEIYTWMKGDNDVYTLNWEPLYAEVGAAGDIGWTWGAWIYKGSDVGGNEVVAHGKYLSIWKKKGGEWKMVADIRNGNPPPQE